MDVKWTAFNRHVRGKLMRAAGLEGDAEEAS
jgi:hypothetical protein